jgi:ferric-dicitrate binding protein FerR (iron transport regulator)
MVLAAAFGAPLCAFAAVPAEVGAVDGDVSIVRAQTGTPEGAIPSATLSAGDYVVTGDGASVTLRIEGQSIRLDARTQLRVVGLDAGSVELQVAAGNVDVAAPASGNGATIDTPTATVRPVHAGTYRVSVNQGGQTLVSTGSGSVTLDGPEGEQVVRPGSSVGSE